jgi:penicillin-binding protein 1B
VPVKVQIESPRQWRKLLLTRSRDFLRLLKRLDVRIGLAAIAAIGLVVIGTFAYFYTKYASIVDERIRRPIFNDAAQIYAAAERVEVGDEWTATAIVNELRKAGYASSTSTGESSEGTYLQHGNTIEIRPGRASYHPGEDASLHMTGGEVDSIKGSKGEKLSYYDLEPQLVTGMFDAKERSKRRLLTYPEIPVLVRNAIVSVEDRRFFEHRGINYVRLMEGLLAPVLRHRRIQGGSTLTMQMARGFFLSNERSVRRKLAEMMIALVLERRFTKEQILEIYVNQVDLGQHGSFNIRGFGEGAQAYFGKDIKSLTLPEAALLAGLVNGPTYFSPFRHPQRAIRRRDIVLQAMFENHVISKQELASAKATPLKLAPRSVEADDAPYYVDLVRDQLLAQYEESDLNNAGMRIYTALDPQLQRAASEAIATGMRQVDQTILKRRTKKIRQGKGRNATVITEISPGPMPQVALIALDPHTGEVLALAGGRDYSTSQLDHAVAKRPTGSIFKPFVYATAINTALSGDPAKAYTQTTMLDATEGTFDWDGKPYSPKNFDPKYSVGEVTSRFALAHSINTATIRLAEMVGYDKVVALAKAAGIENVRPTPAMAIGAYDATPLQMAEAYTVFANDGVREAPVFIRSVRNQNVGEMQNPDEPERTNVLDSRVAFVITDMLEAVLNGGTASSVRARFNAPAAGKTGTSHDAWFAGYTSNLLCLVWVGNDDYSDIKMEGGKAAAPIWTEFMLRAQKLRRYRDMKPFTAPPGVIQVHLDKLTNLPADESCPDDYDAYFVDGTVPAATCDHPNGPSRNFFEKLFGIGVHRELVLPPVTPNPPPNQAPGINPSAPGQPSASGAPPSTTPVPPVKEKKRGFWRKLFGGGKKDKDQNNETATSDTSQQ